ncbi:MAG: InlB B-repeat-containing protein [Coriobacteriales bacterium]|jgi:uncharacterized repeat protein (TIGR02543 family)|nr:InlB B-repeat-containing protein [Coriobacteriales bacterium]
MTTAKTAFRKGLACLLASALAFSLGGLPAAFGVEADAGVASVAEVVGVAGAGADASDAAGAETETGVEPLNASVAVQATDPTGFTYDIRADGDKGADYGAGAYVTGYDGNASRDVVVPATLGGQPVVYVGLGGGTSPSTMHNLTSLNVSACADLVYLHCSNNKLTTLDVSKNAKLAYLDCSFNALATLNAGTSTTLAYLDCSHNKLAALDVGKSTKLESLDCSYNSLAALDASRNVALVKLDCARNLLTLLNVSGCTALTELICSHNLLAALDVSKSTRLTHLACFTNKLTALDVSRNTALLKLECQSNALTALNVSANTALDRLECQSNALTMLDVTKNPRLTYLACLGNRLSALDIRKNTALAGLTCAYNRIPDSTARRAIVARFGTAWILPQVFDIAFDSRSGSAAAGRSVEEGAALGKLPAPKRTGYAFGGWYTRPSGGERVTDATKATTNTTYYAHWKANSYAIAFNANGGKVAGKATASVTRPHGGTLAKLPTASRAGHTFLGWYTGKVKGTKVTVKTKVTKAATYYAHWKANTYTVKFNANGGKVGKGKGAATYTTKRTYSSKVGKLPVPKRSGYKFLGWYTGKVKGAKASGAAKVTKSVTYYAHWRKTR